MGSAVAPTASAPAISSLRRRGCLVRVWAVPHRRSACLFATVAEWLRRQISVLCGRGFLAPAGGGRAALTSPTPLAPASAWMPPRNGVPPLGAGARVRAGDAWGTTPACAGASAFGRPLAGGAGRPNARTHSASATHGAAARNRRAAAAAPSRRSPFATRHYRRTLVSAEPALHPAAAPWRRSRVRPRAGSRQRLRGRPRGSSRCEASWRISWAWRAPP